MKEFNDLIKIVGKLRDPVSGCPWDREQSLDSLKEYIIEESYELVEAIEKKIPDLIKEELGDLLLQIVLAARINQEKKKFDIKDVIDSLSQKLVHRHPHIFGSQKVSNSAQVKSNWEQIKMKEKKK